MSNYNYKGMPISKEEAIIELKTNVNRVKENIRLEFKNSNLSAIKNYFIETFVNEAKVLLSIVDNTLPLNDIFKD